MSFAGIARDPQHGFDQLRPGGGRGRRVQAGDDGSSQARKDLVLAALFCEELGAVLQIRASDRPRVMQTLRDAGSASCSHLIGQLNPRDEIASCRTAGSSTRTSATTCSAPGARHVAHAGAARPTRNARGRIRPHHRWQGIRAVVHLTFQEKILLLRPAFAPGIAILRDRA